MKTLCEKEKLLVTMFSTQSDNCIPSFPFFDVISFAAEFEKPRIGISGKGLMFDDHVRNKLKYNMENQNRKFQTLPMDKKKKKKKRILLKLWFQNN